jgi:CheY-like chemotaxis protein
VSAIAAERYVLLVEDEPALRELYRSTLTRAGFPVVAVEDGIDALRRVESRRPAALVLDLALPRVSGRDVERELRANPETRDIPIVIVSGQDVSDLDPDDFACVLRKPIEPERLILAIQECLRRSGRLF